MLRRSDAPQRLALRGLNMRVHAEDTGRKANPHARAKIFSGGKKKTKARRSDRADTKSSHCSGIILSDSSYQITGGSENG